MRADVSAPRSKPVAALAHALIGAVSGKGKNSAATLTEAGKAFAAYPACLARDHVLSEDPAAIKDTAADRAMDEAAPSWFVQSHCAQAACRIGERPKSG